MKTFPRSSFLSKYFLLISSAFLLSSCAKKTVIETPPVVIKPAPIKKVVKKPVKKPTYTPKKNPTVSVPVSSAKGVSHYRGSSSLPYVALTFDDGPHPTHTPRLLSILSKHNVKATFYVTGENASRYPALIRRMVQEGHEIGNHTYTHPNLTKLSDAQIRSQLNKTVAAISSAANVKPRTFRPPYAAMTSRQRAWVKAEYGYPIIFWDVDPMDWKDRNASIVSSRLLSRARNGSILLLHDIHASSVSAVPSTINGLLNKGFKFVTVSQILSAR